MPWRDSLAPYYVNLTDFVSQTLSCLRLGLADLSVVMLLLLLLLLLFLLLLLLLMLWSNYLEVVVDCLTSLNFSRCHCVTLPFLFSHFPRGVQRDVFYWTFLSTHSETTKQFFEQKYQGGVSNQGKTRHSRAASSGGKRHCSFRFCVLIVMTGKANQNRERAARQTRVM